MINKKEDLYNTYIVNDHGELRDLYLNACDKFGIKRFASFGGEMGVICVWSCNGGHSDPFELIDMGEGELAGEEQLTLADLKPQPKRMREEYVHCGFDREWQAVRHYNEEGELFVIDCVGDFTNVNDISGAWYEVVCKSYNSLYRAVEVEVSERDEFIEAYIALSREFGLQSEIESFYDFMADSGRFKLAD